ncbi:MAG: site-specific DNA-methyltransferase [Chloroflexi bacterium]|nr:site-specific DNA-methyltransferase [Chloroflexota bacterium]
MTILRGDCLVHLPQLGDASIQLVYLDPPFFTQKEHTLRTRDNSNEYSFGDRWASLDDYLAFMREALTHCKRILKSSGSVFLHCDKSASHHLRVLLDEVFGSENFQSDIIWAYKRWSNSKKGLLNAHQTIYFYSKTADFKFNTIFTDYSPTTNIDQILQSRARNEFGKAVYQRDENGDTVMGPEKRGVPLSDVWNIPFLNPKAKERVGYPTQKPVLLLERIIAISTDKGDCVLDPFCGSGTTLVAAKLLGRDYIGIDISTDAIRLSESRLFEPIRTESDVLALGEDRYLEKSEYERSILKAISAVPVERNNGIDGFLKFHVNGRPVSIRIQKRDEDIESAKQRLIQASRSKNCSVMILVRTHRQSERLFAPEADDSNVVVVDAYDLMIDEWLENRGYSKPQLSTASHTG